MGSSSSKNEKNKREEEKNKREEEKNKMKKLIFLIAHQKELLKKVKNNQIKGKEKFYMINETIEKYNFYFEVDEIFNYLSDSNEPSRIEKLNEEFHSIYAKIKESCNFNKAKSKEIEETKKNELNFNNSNDIKYPVNFFLIENSQIQQFLEIFKENYKDYENNLCDVFFVEDYILIESKFDSSQYFCCPLDEKRYNIDFIFVKNNEKDLQKDLMPSIKEFLINEKLKSLRNETSNFKKDIQNFGYVICYPSNDKNKEEKPEFNGGKENRQKFNENDLYNTIKKSFDLCKIYKNFLLSLNETKNYEKKDIKNLISSQREGMSEFFVYALDEENFKKILERIYYTDYLKHCNSEDKEKKIIISNIKTKEKEREDKLEEIPIKLLLYEDIVNKNNKNNICLIDNDFYKNLINEFGKKLNNKEINLLKVNQEYYLYFNQNEKELKINRINDNIWSTKELAQNKNQNQIKENGKEIEDSFISPNIIKKLNLLSFLRNELKEKKKSKNIIYEEHYSLVNKKWIAEYKNHYEIDKVVGKCNFINMKEKDNYNDFKVYLENIPEQKYSIGIKLKGKFPDELKDSNYMLPIKNTMYNDYQYPTQFEIIKNDLFNLLIREDDNTDKYNIEIKENNNYNIILKENIVVLVNVSNYSLYVYNSDNKNNYVLQYIFIFNNLYFLNEQIEILKKQDINNYIIDLELDLTMDVQEIIDIKNGSNKGKFINSKPEKLSISSFKYPPLIGLVNVGATCYMNATLQCFSNIDFLTDFFLKNKNKLTNKEKYDLGSEYLKVILNLWNKKNKTKQYAPDDFKKKIGEKNPLFSGIAANDSKDLVLFILETLHKEFNKSIVINNNNEQNEFNGQISDQTNEKEEYIKFKTDYYNQNDSIISKLFYGEQESFSFCYNCGKTIFSFNIFNILIFPLEKVRQYILNKNNFMNGYVTLNDCFKQYTSPEEMSGPNQMYCNLCRTNSNFSMKNIIFKHPEVLIIILNRGKGLQYQVPFQYPASFILNNYINMNVNNDNYLNNEFIEYELISVITHIGESSMSGHFIACCKSPVDQNWYSYNDAIVTKCADPLNIFGVNSTNSIPYVLFYQIRKKNPNKFDYYLNGNVFEEIVTLYFKYMEKEFFLDTKENMIFEEIKNKMIENYGIKDGCSFQRKNGEKIDLKKTVKENGIENKEKLIIIEN